MLRCTQSLPIARHLCLSGDLRGLSRTEQRVDLVDEDDAGGQLGGEGEEGAHEAHAVAQPLGGEGGWRDGQEGRAAFRRRSARQQRLARACEMNT